MYAPHAAVCLVKYFNWRSERVKAFCDGEMKFPFRLALQYVLVQCMTIQNSTSFAVSISTKPMALVYRLTHAINFYGHA